MSSPTSTVPRQVLTRSLVERITHKMLAATILALGLAGVVVWLCLLLYGVITIIGLAM